MIPGTQVYATPALAIANAPAELAEFGDLPSAEYIIMYRFLMKNGAGGTTNATIVDVTDYRFSGITGASAQTANDHGALSGLADDDHSQYVLADGTRAMVQLQIDDGVVTNAATISFTTDDLYITNNDADGVVYITAEKTGTGQSTLFKGDPDGAAELYYAGSIRIFSNTYGAKITDGTGTIGIYPDASGQILFSGRNGAPLGFFAANNTGTTKYLFNADPDGAADLYYAGVKTFETTTNGVGISDGSTSLGIIVGSGNNQIRNLNNSGWISLATTVSSLERVIMSSQGGVAYLYSSGVNVLQLIDNGIYIRGGTESKGITITHNDTNTTYNNDDWGGGHLFEAINTAGTTHQKMIECYPDGPVDLYYAGIKKFETTEDGVTITDGRIEGNLLIAGNLTVSGTTFTTQTETVQISDNLMVINYGEVSTGVTEGEAGIEIDRGQAANYRFMFDETDDYFVVGISGSEQPVATREESPTQGYVPYWDASNYQFVNTDSPIKRTTSSGVELYYDGAVKLATATGGVTVTGDLTADSMTLGANEVFRFGTDTWIRGTASTLDFLAAGASEFCAKMTANAAVELYYNGNKTFETYTHGLLLKGGSQDLYIFTDSGLFGFQSYVNGSEFRVQGKNDAGTLRSLIHSDPDGAVELYYDGTKTFATTALGAGVGTATASTNVEFLLNGVASKAQRIRFMNSGTDQWLLGAGAASETSAFELYNATGTMALSVDKTTSIPTFSSAIAMKETTTPAAVDSSGKIYTKSDNKLYFQDGAGTEHEIAFV